LHAPHHHATIGILAQLLRDNTMQYELLTDKQLLRELETYSDSDSLEWSRMAALVGEDKFWHDFYYARYRLRVELARRMLGTQPQNSS